MNLESQTIPSATFKWGCLSYAQLQTNSASCCWFRTQKAARTWARQQFGNDVAFAIARYEKR